MQYRSIQKGAVSFAVGDTSKVVTVSAVTMNRTALFFGVRIAQTNANQSAIRGQLTSTTEITFTRNTSGTAAEVEYSLVEVTSGWTVQRGAVTIAAASGSTTATLTSVTTTRTFHVTSLSSTRANIWSSHVFTRSVLTDATTLTFTRVGTTDAVTVEWQAITFDADSDGTVQRGQATLNNGVSTDNETLATAVSLARSFAVASSSFSAAGGQIDRECVELDLTTTTNLAVRRGIASADITLVEWEVVELGTNQVVQNVEVALAAADGNDDDTISAVTTADSFAIIPHFGRFGRSDSTSGDASNASLTTALTSTTNLNSQRASTTGATTTTAYVIELEPTPLAPVITVQPVADVGIISNGQSTVYTGTATGTTISAFTWEVGGTPIADGGIYDIVTTGIGTGSASSTLTITRTAKVGTPFNINFDVTDANGTTASNTVTDTWWDGPQLTTFPATNGSGVSTATLTSDYVTGVGEAIEVRIPLADGDVTVTVTTT